VIENRLCLAEVLQSSSGRQPRSSLREYGQRHFGCGSVVCLLACFCCVCASGSAQTLWVGLKAEIREYTYQGTLIRSFAAQGPATNGGLERLRNMAEDADGSVWCYNGTGFPAISKFEPGSGTWTHYAVGEFSGFGIVYYGGIGIYGRYCFVTDGNTSDSKPRGVLRFDRQTGESVRFSTDIDPSNLAIGLDGLLYVVTNDAYVRVHDPRSLERLRTVELGDDWTLQPHSIAVLSNGEILTTDFKTVSKFSAAGEKIGQIDIPSVNYPFGDRADLNNIVVLPDGRYAVSGRFGEIFVVASDLSSVSGFAVGPINVPAFVASHPSMVGPVIVSDTAPGPLTLGASFTGSVAEFFSSPTGKQLRYEAQNLPDGIAVDPSSGRLTGVPTRPGTYRVTLSAVEQGGVPKRVTTTVTFVVVESTTILANISTRAYCETGNNVAIGGFVLSGTASRKVLIRAVGPSLASQGLPESGLLKDPIIEVHRGEPIVATNDNWRDNANANEIASTALRIGASPIASGDTTSAALLLDLQPGVYSFIARGVNNTAGVVLIEVYDASSDINGSRFVNIAARVRSMTGDNVAIGGFVVSGSGPKRILLRTVGPTLQTQGIAQTEVLADPMIELHDANHGNVVVAKNDNLSDNANVADIITTSARIGATPFASSDHASAALLLTLSPGAYTF
jgi:hypothetical protein